MNAVNPTARQKENGGVLVGNVNSLVHIMMRYPVINQTPNSMAKSMRCGIVRFSM